MAEIISFKNSPDYVLKHSIGNLKSVVILGYDKEGEEYFSAANIDGGTLFWLIERMKQKLLPLGDEEA